MISFMPNRKNVRKCAILPLQGILDIILYVGVTNATEKETLEYIVNFLENATKKAYIVTPNPEILVYASKNIGFRKVLNGAEIALADGVGVTMGGWLLGRPFKSRVTGVDLVKNLCEKLSKKPITVGFLGGGPGVALKAAECLAQQFPNLAVVLAEAGNPDEKTVQTVQEFRKQLPVLHTALSKVSGAGKTDGESGKQPKTSQILDLNKSKNIKIDILFVGFGHPKQELWIAEHLEKLPVTMCMAVGGSLDYISGQVQRAPKAMRVVGLEWLFRLLVQPWRWKRQLALPQFVLLLLKEKFS
jgi:N-acetylglucosaminyldiphosphoundecaprenol N-acetyl-beta-D-mannosaminyltransferase